MRASNSSALEWRREVPFDAREPPVRRCPRCRRRERCARTTGPATAGTSTASTIGPKIGWLPSRRQWRFLLLYIYCTLTTENPHAWRARMAGKKSACLSARYIPRNPARANHRTPSRRAPQAYRFSDSGTQTTSRKTGTISRVEPPLYGEAKGRSNLFSKESPLIDDRSVPQQQRSQP